MTHGVEFQIPPENFYICHLRADPKSTEPNLPPQKKKNKNIFRETAGSCEMSLAHVPISCNLAFHFLPVCPRTQAGTDWHIPPVYLMISVPEFFFQGSQNDRTELGEARLNKMG